MQTLVGVLNVITAPGAADQLSAIMHLGALVQWDRKIPTTIAYRRRR